MYCIFGLTGARNAIGTVSQSVPVGKIGITRSEDANCDTSPAGAQAYQFTVYTTDSANAALDVPFMILFN